MAAYIGMALLGTIGFSLTPIFLATYRQDVFGADSILDRLSAELLGSLHIHVGLNIIQFMFVLLPILFIAMTALAIAIEWFALALSLDPEDRSWSSLKWCLQRTPSLMAWPLAPAILLATAHAALRIEIPTIVPIAICLALFLAHPFVTLNPKNLSGAASPMIWRPSWPGVKTITLCILLLIGWTSLEFVVDLALGALTTGTRLAMIVMPLEQIITGVLSVLPMSIGLYLWMNRTDFHGVRLQLRRVLSRRTLGALLANQLRGLWFAVAIVLPVLAASALLIFAIPQAEASLSESGQSFPIWIDWLILGTRWFSDMNYFPIVLAFAWLASAWNGRLYLSIGMVNESDPATLN